MAGAGSSTNVPGCFCEKTPTFENSRGVVTPGTEATKQLFKTETLPEAASIPEATNKEENEMKNNGGDADDDAAAAKSSLR